MSTKAQKQAERDEAVAKLREILKPGDTVHTILRHVSKSGMSRSISAVVARPSDYDRAPGDRWEPVDISWLVARATGNKLDDRGGVKVSGGGMDMGFALVYDLSHTLFPDGFECIGAGCPSNAHTNGDRDYTPHRHNDGGYALRHRWL